MRRETDIEDAAVRPGDISIDADMPEQETDDYGRTLRMTPQFMALFDSAVGRMPYATILTNKPSGERIKLVELCRFVEQHRDSMRESELKTVLGFLGGAEFRYVRQMMEVVEDVSRHDDLWKLN